MSANKDTARSVTSCYATVTATTTYGTASGNMNVNNPSDNNFGAYTFIRGDSVTIGAATGAYVSQIMMPFVNAPSNTAVVVFLVLNLVSGNVFTVVATYTLPISQLTFTASTQTFTIPPNALPVV